jgi:hypothetical protein
VDLILLAQGIDQWRFFLSRNKPSGSIKGGEFIDLLSEC